MQYFRLRKQVGELLTDLGRTGDEVAMRLRNSGVCGTPKDVHGCAIALYLNAILGTETGIRSIRVDRACVHLSAGRWMMPMSIPLPGAVRTFIQAFDRQLYPELVGGNQEKPTRAG